MKIDKSIGTWGNNMSYLDDLAYHLYCQYRKNRNNDNITTQNTVKNCPKVYFKFYNQSRLLIRIEKIKKIKKNMLKNFN